jgi:hypothetical protein
MDVLFVTVIMDGHWYDGILIGCFWLQGNSVETRMMRGV